jgi:hypothetical protein
MIKVRGKMTTQLKSREIFLHSIIKLPALTLARLVRM